MSLPHGTDAAWDELDEALAAGDRLAALSAAQGIVDLLSEEVDALHVALDAIFASHGVMACGGAIKRRDRVRRWARLRRLREVRVPGSGMPRAYVAPGSPMPSCAAVSEARDALVRWREEMRGDA